MELIRQLFDTLIHLSPQSVSALAEQVGPGLYAILFAIIFAETGLVATPFLPGDSLLFAVGAVAASPGSPINLTLVCVLLAIAAVLGDAVNYAIGYYVGPKVFSRQDSWLLNRKHLIEAHEFYERYGAITIILARFMPVIRTFAPFVAGIGKMTYYKFALYNVTGGIAWVLLFLVGGWWFGSMPTVQKNFHLVILAIIVISILPPAVQFARSWLGGRQARAYDKPAAVESDAH
ncbi:MAG TPA: DedA family protein [Isosphaeraceae bacterium]|nr:DedA family protein [Isosphaeraceae bacterium]